VKQPHATPPGKPWTSRKARRTWGPLKLGKVTARALRRPKVKGTSTVRDGYFTLDDLRRERELRDHWAKAHPLRSRLTEAAYSTDRWISSVLHLTWYRRTRTFITRGRQGWAPRDIWSLDHYLTRVIGDEFAWAAGLIGDTVLALDRTSHSYPADGMTPGQWRDILLDISIPLRAYQHLWDESTREDRTREQNRAAEDKIIDDAAAAFRLLADHLPSLWD